MSASPDRHLFIFLKLSIAHSFQIFWEKKNLPFFTFLMTFFYNFFRLFSTDFYLTFTHRLYHPPFSCFFSPISPPTIFNFFWGRSLLGPNFFDLKLFLLLHPLSLANYSKSKLQKSFCWHLPSIQVISSWCVGGKILELSMQLYFSSCIKRPSL